MSDADLFAVPPQLWFAVLCEEVGIDRRGRLDLRRVFNQVTFVTPPPDTGIQPHAHLVGIIAIGFSEGVGEFTAAIEMQAVEGRVLWRAERPWRFRMGPGEPSAAVHGEHVDYWFSEPGRYRFVIGLDPGPLGPVEHVVNFDVAAMAEPGVVVQEDMGRPR